MQKGTKTVIFDDSGRYMKVIVDARLIGNMDDYAKEDTNLPKFLTPETNQLLIRTPTMMAMVNLKSLQGVRSASPQPFFAGSELFDSTRKIVSRDTILGKPCEVSEFRGAFRVWMWKGIQLKTESIAQGGDPKVSVTAVFLDDHYVINPDEFKIPKNVKVVEQ
jgi:hypothetical protein